MTHKGFKRKLTAILSADVKGYSRLMGANEEATVRTLTSYRGLISTLIEEHQGRVIDSPGDNLLAEFPSVVVAVRCALEIQEELKGRNAELPEERRMEFRIGVNLGDVIVEGERIYGDGVNIAARVENLADGGGICVSGTVFEQIENKLDLAYEYLGEKTVKNISKPVRVYRVEMEREAAPKEGIREQKLPDKPSVAVLPFVNMSGDPEQEYFSDGITEEIITGLSKVPRLLVIARNSSFTYKGKSIKVQQVGQELGVRYVLEGSVRKAGDRVRITAQLVNAETGHHLWAERYDRDLRDIFAIQDEITLKIMTEMAIKLTEGEQARILAKGTDNVQALEKTIRGWEFMKAGTKDGSVLARQMFEEAIASDPGYARAYELLAGTHLNDVLMGASEFSDQSIQKAVELAEKAQAMDDSLPEACALIGNIHLMKREHQKAIAQLERAVALAPNAAAYTMLLGMALLYSGKPGEAATQFEKSIRLDPFPPSFYYGFLGIAYRFVGRYEEAVEAFKNALEQDPENLYSYIGLAITYTLLDEDDKAGSAASKVLKLDPKFSVDRFTEALPYEDQADKEHIADALRKAGLK